MIQHISIGTISHVTSSKNFLVMAKYILHYWSIFVFTSSWSHPRWYGHRYNVISRLSLLTKLAEMRFFWHPMPKITPITFCFTWIFMVKSSSQTFRSEVGFESITFDLAISDRLRSRYEIGESLIVNACGRDLSTLIVLQPLLWEKLWVKSSNTFP